MTRARWLILVAVAGVAIFGLSFVNAWINHDRELRGEGYRWVQHGLSAWRGVGMPVLTAVSLVALGTAGWAVALLRNASLPAWPAIGGSVIVVGLAASAAYPVSQDSHASSVDLSAGPLVAVGVLLGLAMLIGSLAAAGRGRRMLGAAVVGVLVLGVAGSAARWAGLQAAEGTGRHWTEGSYTRAVTAEEPEETLTIRDGTFAVGDRWSGTWDWSGWTVIITDDPACPEARGTYHAHDAGEGGLRFVKVVDVCRDGERGRDLETGIWERDG